MNVSHSTHKNESSSKLLLLNVASNTTLKLTKLIAKCIETSTLTRLEVTAHVLDQETNLGHFRPGTYMYLM